MAYLQYDFLYGSSDFLVLQTLSDTHHATKTSLYTFFISKIRTYFTNIRFLPCVYSHVRDQFVLGIEWFNSPGTPVPHTGELLASFLVLFMVVLDVVHQCVSIHELFATIPPPAGDDPALTSFLTWLLLHQ